MLSAHWEGFDQGQIFYLKIPQHIAQETKDSSCKSTPFPRKNFTAWMPMFYIGDRMWTQQKISTVMHVILICNATTHTASNPNLHCQTRFKQWTLPPNMFNTLWEAQIRKHYSITQYIIYYWSVIFHFYSTAKYTARHQTMSQYYNTHEDSILHN